MLLLKQKTLAFSLAAIMLLPTAAYGQSSEVSTADARDCIPQFIQFLEYLGIRWEEGNVPDMDEAIPQSEIAREMLAQVNQQRRQAGLSELKLSQGLTKVADIKAKDMRDNGYFSHTSPTYGSPFDMMKEFGINYTIAGENIAKGQKSVETVMADWMNSEGHRANILNKNFTHLGVGYCTDASGNTYWIKMFIGE